MKDEKLTNESLADNLDSQLTEQKQRPKHLTQKHQVIQEKRLRNVLIGILTGFFLFVVLVVVFGGGFNQRFLMMFSFIPAISGAILGWLAGRRFESFWAALLGGLVGGAAGILGILVTFLLLLFPR